MFGFLRRAFWSDEGVAGSLTGSFDVRGEALVGVVCIEEFMPTEGMIVEAAKRGMIIASCAAGPDPGNHRLPFTMPLDAGFDLRDLGREAVTLTARNRRGDTGTLTLNGTTQMALIRMGAPAEVIFDIDLRRGGDTGGFLGNGWAAPERNVTWTLGDNSVIRFPRPAVTDAAPRGYLLRLRFNPYVTREVPEQRLEIYLNNELVADLTVRGDSSEFYECRLDAAIFAGGDAKKCKLRLHHPNAQAATPDGPRIAFAFRRATLSRPLE